MAEADALRMTAEVVDKFSGPLKNLQNMLRGIGAGTQTKQLKQEFDSLHASASKVGREVKDVISPALAGMGIASLTVGGALVGIGAALRAFSGNTAQLSLLSREVGLSAQKLREFGAVGSHFGLDEGAMQGASRAFAQNMRDMRTGASDTLAWLRAQGKTGEQRAIFQGFALDLKNTKSNEEALAKTLDFLEKIPDAVERGMVAQRLLGNSALGILGSENWRKVIAEARKDLGTLGPEAEKNALAAERGFGRVQNQLLGLRDAIAADVMPEVNELTTGVRKFFEENRGEIKSGIIGFLRDLRSYDWKGTFGSIREALTSINDGVQKVGGWTTILAVLLGIKALKLGLEIKAVAGSLLGLGKAADTVLAGGALARVIGLLTTPLAAGSVGLALAAIFGMKVAGDARAKTIGGETENELADVKQRKAEFEANAKRMGLDDNDSRVRDRRELFDDQIKKLEEKLGKLKEQGLDKGAVQEGTKKGMLEAFREWMFSKTSATGGDDGKYGGASVQRASYGGSARARGGAPDGRSGSSDDEASDGLPSGRGPRMPSPRDVGRAPGVPETRERLGGGEQTGGPANGKHYSAAEMAQIAMRNGATREEATILGGIALAESRGNRRAFNGRGRDQSYGLWQVNMLGAMGPERRKRFGLKSNEDLYDPDTNARAAISLMREAKRRGKSGFGDWSTYNDGKYRAGLRGAAEGARNYDPNSKTEPPVAESLKPGPGEYLRYDLRTGKPVAIEKYDNAEGGLRGQWPSMWRGKGAGDQESPDFNAGVMKGFDAFRNRPGQEAQQPGGLLDRARDSGVMGGQSVDAKGSVNVRLEGFPKGVKASTSMDGLFKEVSLSRGASMPMSEDV